MLEAIVSPETGEPETIEAWAERYVTSSDLAYKMAPPPLPDRFALRFEPLRLTAPGRSEAFDVQPHGVKSSGKSQLRSGEKRARLIHSFLHHELQAAELMAWAVLAFPDAPAALRKGLIHILLDEVRHMNLYGDLLTARGFALLSFPVRDWFWQRIPTVPSISGFLATLGLGFEGANLDHAARFTSRFRAAGDTEAAAVEERVGLEEIPHVRFALTWFRELSPELRAGASLFDAFRASLPEPLSPMVMRGNELAHDARRAAGLPADFMQGLEAWQPV
jgi:uncharacterized ferritin-like protein (DUF455 family)